MISIVMLCKNNEKHIKKTLNSLLNFKEIILIDTGSKDKTLEIAKSFSNVRIYQKKFEGFGELRNLGAKLAINNWILAIDTDEVLSTELQDEVFSINLKTNTIYEIPFKNFYNGKWIKGCGWYPESHIRLYNKKETSFSNSKVHETVLKKKLKISRLNNYIHHTSYNDTHDFLEKMQNYSSLFAAQNFGKKSSLKKAIVHGAFAFFKSYFLKYGFRMGKEGFEISLYNANTAFYKYMKLHEQNKKANALNTLIPPGRSGKIQQ